MLAVILPLALLGCGWHPLYADRQSAPASAELRAIHVEPISDRVGQRLEIALRDALDPTGGGGPTRYDLRTQLTVSRSDFGVQSQGVATRGRVDITANFALADLKTGQILFNDSARATDSYDVDANGYVTIVAENDAGKRAVTEIADEMMTRLNLFMQRRAASAARPG